MSQFDENMRDFARMLDKAADDIRYAIEVQSYHDCNDCGCKSCKYKPKPGELVRINCPLWKREE